MRCVTALPIAFAASCQRGERSMNRSIKDLARAYQDQTLSDQEVRQLDEVLGADADAREIFLQETNLLAGLEDIACDEPAHAALADNDGASQRWMMFAGWAVAAVAAALVCFASLWQPDDTPNVAKITGLSGALIWTGDRGQIVRNINVGTQLAGGTIEGIAPDSWFELQFNDGSTAMISGTSTLTFADIGQKTLRLREGRLSANVEPQPAGKPMLIHTRSAVMEVLGTQFDVEANQTSTLLNVNEGKVRLRRLSDGMEVDVPAQHSVVAEDETELTPKPVKASVNQWKSQLDRQRGGYGKWLPATSEQPAAQKAIAFVPPDDSSVVLYLLSIPVVNESNSPITVLSESRFVVRGRLNAAAKVFFGIGLSYDNGEFAGKFRGDLGIKQPAVEIDSEGRFELVYRLSDFTLDPCVLDRKAELAQQPDGLVLDELWCFTHTDGPSGLEVTDVQLLPPEVKTTSP